MSRTKHQIKLMSPEKFKQALSKLQADGYDSFFAALTSDLDRKGIQVYGIPGKGYCFFYAASGINEEQNKRVKP
jgi:hypothetical protein